MSDPTGKFCDRNQPKDIWFLAGTFGGTAQRACRVPAGRPMLAPLVNLASTRAGCKKFMAAAKGKATLDGKPVTPERMEDAVVHVTSVADNPATGMGGTTTFYACGIWARFQPLPPGHHTLSIRGSSGAFHTAVDYTLTVETAQQA
ncbi:signal protein [Nonomuraea sp. NPDC049028]|uniref:signal protein n=2 Tax=unclassified Nonomuraea TaxID=2593643 RepID=UPI0037223B37